MKKLSVIFTFLAIGALFYACGENERDCPDRTLVNNKRCDSYDTTWVCACNDSSYINECFANEKGYWVVSNGKCK